MESSICSAPHISIPVSNPPSCRKKSFRIAINIPWTAGVLETKHCKNIDRAICINLEHDVARGILKFKCKTWEFRATWCSRHPDLFISFLKITSERAKFLFFYKKKKKKSHNLMERANVCCCFFFVVFFCFFFSLQRIWRCQRHMLFSFFFTHKIFIHWQMLYVLCKLFCMHSLNWSLIIKTQSLSLYILCRFHSLKICAPFWISFFFLSQTNKKYLQS